MESAHRAFFALLIFFALNAERRLRPRLETLLADRFVADLAHAERAVLDLLEREVELRQQALLASTQTELEGLDVLARCEVHLVREIIRVERHAFGQHLPRA